jgi:hypothetical protein
LKSVDPTITVISPSPTAVEGIAWLSGYLQKGGCAYADVIGYHFYVTPQSPEAMVALITKVKDTARRYSCDSKPVWNTESGWSAPKQFSSDEEAAGYLMRTYLLDWLLGVQRCYWYAWDNHNWSTLDLTSRSNNEMSSVGASYGVLHQWMVGAVLRSCIRERPGSWICQLDRGAFSDRIVWAEKGHESFNVPASWHARTITTWTGKSRPAISPVDIGPAPLLLSGQ